jgi:Trk K+ transport system NAD-binding subunit
MDTLQHAHIESAKVVFCSISDAILRGTTNQKMLLLLKRLCPNAQVIVTANTLQSALSLYEQGAAFVFIPRLHAADYVARALTEALHAPLDEYKNSELRQLENRKEVLD